MTLRERLEATWRDRPEVVIFALAAAARIAAAVLSRGFAFHDDHFEVVEVAQRWLDGHRDWLGRADSLRSLLYPGLHWLALGALRAVGIGDPQAQMTVVRLLNGAWSMVTVIYGFRVAEALGGRDRARTAGLLLAVFWIAPFGAVHDLVEVASTPALVLALWLLVRGGDDLRPRDAFLAGLWLALAFALRFQTATFAAALGGVLLARRRVAPALALAAGGGIGAAVLVGAIDWIGYGRPFSSLIAYVAYNGDPAIVAGYPTGPWYQYLLTLLGVLIPPTSLLLLAGVVKVQRHALLFWPTLAFLAFHSIYPGKQERFLFPILPVLLILGALGARELAEGDALLARRPRLVAGLWRWFWAANTALLVLYTANYSKRTRVAPLSFLHDRGDARAVVVETSEARGAYVPAYYLGTGVPVFSLPASREVTDLRAELLGKGWPRPSHVVLTGAPRLDERLARLAAVCASPRHLATFRPGAVDWLLHRMNPRHNVNLTARVYACAPAAEGG